MTICPNCSYKLVLLSNRLNYKCALCSKLYSQKYIENREFHQWDKKQRELDINNYQIEYKNELVRIKELKKHIKQLFKNQRKENRLRVNRLYRKWKEKNKDKLEQWRQQNTLSKDYKNKVKLRLNYYRLKQKQLTILYFKKHHKKLSTDEFFKSPPTFVHSYLLSRK